MIRRTTLAVALTLALALSGCALAPTPLPGLLYTSVSYPGQVWHGLETAKKGEACASSILGLFATGDASIEAAKQDGGIREVTSVDHESTSIFGLYATYCTIVTGK